MSLKQTTFGFPTIGLTAPDRAILLGIDDILLPLRKNLCLYMTRPAVRPEPVLVPNRDNPNSPDFLGIHLCGTVLLEQGRFRCWYYPISPGANPDWPPEMQAQWTAAPDDLYQGPLCYAESADGIHWTKPVLEQVMFKGSTRNNALLLPNIGISANALIRDDDDPDPNRRYKLVYEYFLKDGKAGPAESWGTMRTATSADGITWTPGARLPVDDFVEFASFYKHNGLYIVSGHKMGFWCPFDGYDRGRVGFVWVSPDFDHWLQESAESFALPEPLNPAQRGKDMPYDQVHHGVGAVSLGNVLVGLYGIWHNNPEWGEIGCDLGLVIGHDGFTFHEPARGQVFLAAEDTPVTPWPGVTHRTLLLQANAILDVGDETWIYHGRWRNADYVKYPERVLEYYGEVGLATIPRDRWGGLGLFPAQSQGSVWSAPVRLPDGPWQLLLNADGASAMRIEISDGRFGLLPEFSGAHAATVAAPDGLDCPVIWPTGHAQALCGQTVRLRVTMDRALHPQPRLYAMTLTAARGGE